MVEGLSEYIDNFKKNHSEETKQIEEYLNAKSESKRIAFSDLSILGEYSTDTSIISKLMYIQNCFIYKEEFHNIINIILSLYNSFPNEKFDDVKIILIDVIKVIIRLFLLKNDPTDFFQVSNSMVYLSSFMDTNDLIEILLNQWIRFLQEKKYVSDKDPLQENLHKELNKILEFIKGKSNVGWFYRLLLMQLKFIKRKLKNNLKETNHISGNPKKFASKNKNIEKVLNNYSISIEEIKKLLSPEQANPN